MPEANAKALTLGLTEVPPECFEGLPDSVRSADLSQVGGCLGGVGACTQGAQIKCMQLAPCPDPTVPDTRQNLNTPTPNHPKPTPHKQNQLTAVAAAISQLSSLAALRLADNQLQDGGVLWSALGQLQALTLLTLDRNRLTLLPDALSACSGLVKLSAAGNQIAAVEAGALAQRTQAVELDLADNALTELPESIGLGFRV